MVPQRFLGGARPLDSRLIRLAMILGVTLVALVYGFLVTRELPAIVLIVLPVAALAALLGALQVELLAVALLGITWGYISEVLVKFHGIPSISKPLVALIVALILQRRYLGRGTRLRTHPLLWWMLGYMFVLGAGLWYAQYPERTWLVVIDFAKELLLFFVVINTLTSERWLERGVWAMLLVGAVYGGLTLYQEAVTGYGNDFGGFARSSIGEIAEGVSNRRRAGGPTSEPNAFGQQLLTLVPIGLWATLYARTPAGRVLGAVAAFACLSGAALSFSRGTYLAILVTVIALGMHLRLNPRFLLVLPVLLIALSVAPPELRARFGTLDTLLPVSSQANRERDASLERREIEMLMAVYMFADHPIVGVGADNYAAHFSDYVKAYGSNVDVDNRNAHSYYLEVAAEHGLVGLIVVGAILALSIGALRRARRRFLALGDRRMAELMAALLIGLVGYAVSATFLHGDYSRFLWLQVDIAAACALIAARAQARVGAALAQPAPAVDPAAPAPGLA